MCAILGPTSSNFFGGGDRMIRRRLGGGAAPGWRGGAQVLPAPLNAGGSLQARIARRTAKSQNLGAGSGTPASVSRRPLHLGFRAP